MRTLSHLLLALCLCASITACASHTDSHAQAGHTSAKSAHGQAHWDYENGEHGPANWAKLDCPDCAGKMQSPIDVPAGAKVTADDITFNYLPTKLDITNNGHTIKLNADKQSKIIVGGKTWNLLQLHFHAPSEHTIAGKFSPMEMHLVHQTDAGEYGVVGVMIVEGAANTAIQTLWNQMPQHVGDHADDEHTLINAINLLPAKRTYYNYSGSFTTPPCTEGVNWMLMTEPITVSADQLKAFTKLYDHNNRPVQPLNGRF